MKSIEFLDEFSQLLKKYNAFICSEPDSDESEITEFKIIIGGNETVVIKESYLTDLVIEQKILGGH